MTSSDKTAEFPFSVLLAGPFNSEIAFTADQTILVDNVTAEAPSKKSYVTIMRAGSGSEDLPLGQSTQKVAKGTTLLAAAEEQGVKIMLSWKDA